MNQRPNNILSVSEIHKITAYFQKERFYEQDSKRIESNILMERAKSNHLNNMQYELQKKQKQNQTKHLMKFGINNNNNHNNNIGMNSADIAITPVTLKQLNIAMNAALQVNNEKCIIDGREIHNICIIGKRIDVDKNYHNQQWWTISESDGNNKYNNMQILFNTNITTEEWKENKNKNKNKNRNRNENDNNLTQKDTRNWYKIYASINYKSEPKQEFVVQGFHQILIEDKNEITMHFIECIHAHLYNTTDYNYNA